MADQKPQLPPESHYDPKKLNFIFAIVAIVLLLSLIGIFAKDYSRKWKDYQRQFRDLEVEKTRVKIDAESKEIESNQELKDLTASLTKAEAQVKAQATKVKALEDQISTVEAQKRLHTKYSQDTKAEFAALKYRYEAVSNHEGKSNEELKNKLDRLEATINDYRLKLEADEAQLTAKNNSLKEIQKDVRDLQKKRAGIVKKQEILTRKLKRIDTEQMSPANQLADVIRDLPIIDLANPNFKIRQIVLKEIPEDVNFMKVPRVDRCTTCHLGIDNPDYVNAPQPFTTHPDLKLYMDKNSPHPLEEFGCTTCHLGRGRATDFVAAAHTPRDEEQKKEWEKKYGWEELHHWDTPMYSTPVVQASCYKCHQDQSSIKGADKLNLGLALIERAGCYNCHNIPKYNNWPKSGPSLEFIASKTTPAWAYRWIENPKSIRPDTWMPSYFNQANNKDAASLRRSQQEIHAIVHYLFKNSKPYELTDKPATAAAEHGKELVSSLGCYGCHDVKQQPSNDKRTRDSLHREFGPNLVGLGSKTSKAWLVDWLKDPKRYHPQSRMPNLRISDEEAADIAEYLIQDKSSAINKPIAEVDDKILNNIVADFLKKTLTMDQVKVQLNSMSSTDKLNFAGQRLIREYGCYSCHNIPGFANEKPIGTDLSQQGDKDLHRLDFGFVHIEHSKKAWTEQKLLSPRVYDQGKVLQPLEKLKMPNFGFTPDEAEAVTTAVLGFVKERPNASKMPNQGVKAAFINEGRKTVRQLNCQGCHIIEGEGGTIQPNVNDWLVKYQGKDPNDAKAMTLSFSPPNLIGEGAKIQAQWLFEFIDAPVTIRPWLHVRMPSYRLHATDINSLVKYFNYLDNQEFPFTDIYHPNITAEEKDAALKLFSKDIFNCAQCHIVGNQMPSGTPDGWAPNFALAAKRLKPEWIVEWIKNPAALLPGTKMPTYFDPNTFADSGPPDILNGDEMHQIRALRDYLLTLSSSTTAVSTPNVPAAKEAEKPAGK